MSYPSYTRRDFLIRAAGLLAAAGAPSLALGKENGGERMADEKSDIIKLPASFYQQFDADHKLDVPGEGYGGWKKAEIEISRDHTAVVVMHAWDQGTRERYPGWYRAVEYILRANEISRKVLPGLLSAVRKSGMKLFHVASGDGYARKYPGYKRAVELAGPEPPELEQIKADPLLERLHKFRSEHVFVGKHNGEDVRHGFENVDFAPDAKPLDDEGIAETGHQLFALCNDAGINHLIYAGFAINWCLLLSPGGMADMSRRGLMCSALRQATTAVENKESARAELHKEEGLWRVSLAYGFVFDVEDFVKGIGC